MSNGYRFIIVAVGGIALFAALSIGAYFGSLYSPNHKQYQSVASNQRGQDDYQGPSQSLPDIAGLPSAVERAIANPRSSTGEDHEKRDLAAQEASALWAFYMVIASFASVLITAFGTAFLYKQIVLTREAVEDTGDATKAMIHANKIAETAQRPYLHIDRMAWERSDSFDAWYFVVQVKNFGQTPARDFTIMADVRYSTDRQPPIIWRVTQCESSDIIPQNKTERILVKCYDPRTRDVNNRLYLEDTYCRFELRYKDSFGNQFGLFETHARKLARNGGDDTFRFHSSP